MSDTWIRLLDISPTWGLDLHTQACLVIWFYHITIHKNSYTKHMYNKVSRLQNMNVLPCPWVTGKRKYMNQALRHTNTQHPYPCPSNIVHVAPNNHSNMLRYPNPSDLPNYVIHVSPLYRCISWSKMPNWSLQSNFITNSGKVIHANQFKNVSFM